MNLFLFFSHRLTDEQKQDAIDSLNVKNFIELPSELEEVWSNIPPDLEDLNSVLKPFKEFLKNVAKEGDYVLISGDFGATFQMAKFCYENNLLPIYATTKRETIEIKLEDGKVEKRSIFEHVRYRRM